MNYGPYTENQVRTLSRVAFKHNHNQPQPEAVHVRHVHTYYKHSDWFKRGMSLGYSIQKAGHDAKSKLQKSQCFVYSTSKMFAVILNLNSNYTSVM